MVRFRRICLIIPLCVLVLVATGWWEKARSQEQYPSRAIDVIVAFGAGGGIDLNTRTTANFLNKKWEVPVNVINKPGGKNIPATLELYKARPDGYTMFGDCNVTSSLMGATMTSLPFDVMERTYIATVSAVPYVISVPASSPYKNLKEFVAAAKKNPDEFSFIAGDVGLEFGLRRFAKTVGIDISKMKPVMVTGAAQAVSLTAGGHVSLLCSMASSSLPAITAGTIRPLLIGYDSRYPKLPDVPTSAEQGFPKFVYVGWIGISGPPKLPSRIVEVWSNTLKDKLKDPEVISQFAKIGSQIFYHGPEETREYVMNEMEEARKILGK